MATISFSPLHSILTHSHSLSSIPISPPTLSFPNISGSFRRLTSVNSRRPTIVRSAEEDTPAFEPVPEEAEQPVSVPVSPSDTLTMFFQADGSLSDAAVPVVTKALEETEGITDLKVEVHEGIGIVEVRIVEVAFVFG